MRTVESQITSVYPSQTNFVVEAYFTWDHDVTLVHYGGTTVTVKAGEHLQASNSQFRPGGTKITAQISSGSYPVGLSACKCATIEMYDGGWQNVDNRNLYEGATVHLNANITIDGNGYLVPMGSFKVYEVETVHEVTTLTCYDAMKEADVLCPTEMQGDHNYKELWELAAQQIGLTASAIDSDLGYNALATVDAQHTIRQVIEAIALACGGNAMVSGDALYVRPITSAADVTLTQWINQLEVASTPVEVTGVRVKKTFASDGQEHTYFSGAGGYVIELNDDNLWLGIEGPSGSITVAAEAVAETVYEQLKNKPIYKFSGEGHRQGHQRPGIPVNHHGLHIRFFRQNVDWQQRRIRQQLQHVRRRRIRQRFGRCGWGRLHHRPGHDRQVAVAQMGVWHCRDVGEVRHG